VEYTLPKGIQVEIDKQTALTVKGVDREKVGCVSAQIRALRPPEPYKGTGIRYQGEHIRRKLEKQQSGGRCPWWWRKEIIKGDGNLSERVSSKKTCVQKI